jgi:hypothetical protein
LSMLIKEGFQKEAMMSKEEKRWLADLRGMAMAHERNVVHRVDSEALEIALIIVEDALDQDLGMKGEGADETCPLLTELTNWPAIREMVKEFRWLENWLMSMRATEMNCFPGRAVKHE